MTTEFKVTVSMEIKRPDGSIFRHEETKLTTCTGNPLYLAAHAELACAEVAENVAGVVAPRFGDIRVATLAVDGLAASASSGDRLDT